MKPLPRWLVVVAVLFAVTVLVVVARQAMSQTSVPSQAGPETLAREQLARTPTEIAVSEAAARLKAATRSPKPAPKRESGEGPTETPRPAPRQSAGPLRGVTIALDPGHQLGNKRFPRQVNAPVEAGGFSKPCNSTGTATDSGVAEATVNMQLARAVTKRLEALDARVRLTRSTNSERLWGPCIDARGRFGKRVGARLMVSLHADGAPTGAEGFHVIAPTGRAPWTDDIATASLRLAKGLRDGLTEAGVPRSSYIGGGSGLDVRNDLGTLNLADVPVAMVEVGNMRNATDARRMTTATGRAAYAEGIVRGIRRFLDR